MPSLPRKDSQLFGTIAAIWAQCQANSLESVLADEILFTQGATLNKAHDRIVGKAEKVSIATPDGDKIQATIKLSILCNRLAKPIAFV